MRLRSSRPRILTQLAHAHTLARWDLVTCAQTSKLRFLLSAQGEIHTEVSVELLCRKPLRFFSAQAHCPTLNPQDYTKLRIESGAVRSIVSIRRVHHGDVPSALVPSQAMLRSLTSMCSTGHTIDTTVVAIIDATRNGGELAVAARGFFLPLSACMQVVTTRAR